MLSLKRDTFVALTALEGAMFLSPFNLSPSAELATAEAEAAALGDRYLSVRKAQGAEAAADLRAAFQAATAKADALRSR